MYSSSGVGDLPSDPALELSQAQGPPDHLSDGDEGSSASLLLTPSDQDHAATADLYCSHAVLVYATTIIRIWH